MVLCKLTGRVHYQHVNASLTASLFKLIYSQSAKLAHYYQNSAQIVHNLYSTSSYSFGDDDDDDDDAGEQEDEYEDDDN